MPRSIPCLLGPLFVFAAWLTFEPGSAAAATKQKQKRAAVTQRVSMTSSRRTSSAKRRGAAAGKTKAPPPPEKESEAVAAAPATPSAVRGPSRIEFGERLIQGQTNKSGAVYLYDRKELTTPSMIKKRESFREETLATIYGN